MTNGPERPGHTRIRTRALERLAQYVGSEALRVKPREVNTELRDSGSNLGVTLSSGIRDSDLELCANRTDTTLFTYADKAAKTFVDKMSRLSGYTIGDVDIRFTHVVDTTPERRRVR